MLKGIYMRKYLLLLIFLLSLLLFSQTSTDKEKKKYNYDFSNPESLVYNLYSMLKNTDFEEMLKITELYEKRRVEKTIDEVTNTAGTLSILKKEAAKIKRIEIVGTEYYTNDATNQLAIVVTKWYVVNETILPKHQDIYDGIEKQLNPNPRSSKDSVIYVDYMLKKFGEKWKIISKRSK